MKTKEEQIKIAVNYLEQTAKHVFMTEEGKFLRVEKNEEGKCMQIIWSFTFYRAYRPNDHFAFQAAKEAQKELQAKQVQTELA